MSELDQGRDQDQQPAAPRGAQVGDTNRYGGPCVGCGRRVRGGEGFLAGKAAGRWTVRHAECAAAGDQDQGDQGAREPRQRPRATSRGYRSRSRGMCEDAPCCGCCGPGSGGPGDYTGGGYGGGW